MTIQKDGEQDKIDGGSEGSLPFGVSPSSGTGERLRVHPSSKISSRQQGLVDDGHLTVCKLEREREVR